MARPQRLRPGGHREQLSDCSRWAGRRDDVYQSLFARDSAWGRLSQTIGERLSGRGDMAMPLMRGIGPTLILRPQRTDLAFGEPISTTKPACKDAATWLETVRDTTKQSLEEILADLQVVRAEDPFRRLNPLAWPNAVEPATLKTAVPEQNQ